MTNPTYIPCYAFKGVASSWAGPSVEVQRGALTHQLSTESVSTLNQCQMCATVAAKSLTSCGTVALCSTQWPVWPPPWLGPLGKAWPVCVETLKLANRFHHDGGTKGACPTLQCSGAPLHTVTCVAAGCLQTQSLGATLGA